MNTATAQVYTLPEREFQQRILDMTKAGGYSPVLRTLQAARGADPRNIFVIALERQVKRMEALAESGGEGCDEMRTLTDSLPALIQRAWSDAKSRGLALPVPGMEEAAIPPPAPAPVHKSPPADTTTHAPVVQAAARHSQEAADTPVQAGLAARTIWFAIAATVAVLAIAATYFVMRSAKQPQTLVVIAQPVQSDEESVQVEAVTEPTPEVNTEAAKTSAQPTSSEPVDRGSTSSGKERERRSLAAERKPTTAVPEETRGSTGKQVPPARPAAVAAVTAGGTAVSLKNSAAVAEAAEVRPEPESPEPFIPVQREPRIIKLVEPELNEAMRARKTEGEVVARVLIDTEGKALKVRIVKSTNTTLNQPVAQALLKSEFEPGVMTNGPVQSWLTVPFKFR